jgi:hypothetical protein
VTHLLEGCTRVCESSQGSEINLYIMDDIIKQARFAVYGEDQLLDFC